MGADVADVSKQNTSVAADVSKQMGDNMTKMGDNVTKMGADVADVSKQMSDNMTKMGDNVTKMEAEVQSVQMQLCSLFDVQPEEVAFAFDSHGLKDSWNDENLCADALRIFLKKDASQVCV